jgi:hypothetical protein
VNIWVKTNEWHDEYRIYEDGTYFEVNVPMSEVARILGERYDLPAKQLEFFLNEYDIDGLEEDDDIKDLAYEIYYKLESECV